jgi:hypothetical protein
VWPSATEAETGYMTEFTSPEQVSQIVEHLERKTIDLAMLSSDDNGLQPLVPDASEDVPGSPEPPD